MPETPNEPASKPDAAGIPATRIVHRDTIVKKGGRKRLLVLAGLVAAAVAALLYARCAGGLGFGRGDGEADKRPAVQPVAETRPGVPAETVRPPCELRLDATGLTVDGTLMEIDGAIEACKPAGKAKMTVVGDAKYGAMVSIREALEGAGITVLGP
jgi:hypothetical protein